MPPRDRSRRHLFRSLRVPGSHPDCLGTHGGRHQLVPRSQQADGERVPLAQAFLAYALGLGGRAGEARELLAGLSATREQRYVPPAYLAVAEIGVGETERAFKALEDAYAAKDGTLLFLRILPVFRPLRDDPRFEDLCRRLALPNPSAAALGAVEADTHTWERARAVTRG